MPRKLRVAYEEAIYHVTCRLVGAYGMTLPASSCLEDASRCSILERWGGHTCTHQRQLEQFGDVIAFGAMSEAEGRRSRRMSGRSAKDGPQLRPPRTRIGLAYRLIWRTPHVRQSIHIGSGIGMNWRTGPDEAAHLLIRFGGLTQRQAICPSGYGHGWGSRRAGWTGAPMPLQNIKDMTKRCIHGVASPSFGLGAPVKRVEGDLVIQIERKHGVPAQRVCVTAHPPYLAF